MYTLQLTNVHLHNCAEVSSQKRVNILVTNGVIEQISEFPIKRGCPVVDMRGGRASAGWIDCHTHVYFGATDMGVRIEDCGLAVGVHVLVDAGSAGEANFVGLHEYVIAPAKCIVKSYLNLGPIGLVAGNRISEFVDLQAIDPDRIARIVQEHRAVIKGLKLRMSGTVVGTHGLELLKLGKQIADQVQLPLVIHIGEPQPQLTSILELLEPGSLVTHCYHGKDDNSILEPHILDSVKDAVQKGILLDVGHGKASFTYEAARVGIGNGICPFSVSTDLHCRNIGGPVWDLPTVMTKMLHVGLSLDQVIDCVTWNPGMFLDESERTIVTVGQRANLTLFDVCDTEMWLPDSMGRSERITRAIVPCGVVFNGAYSPIDASQLPSPIYRGTSCSIS